MHKIKKIIQTANLRSSRDDVMIDWLSLSPFMLNDSWNLKICGNNPSNIYGHKNAIEAVLE